MTLCAVPKTEGIFTIILLQLSLALQTCEGHKYENWSQNYFITTRITHTEN